MAPAVSWLGLVGIPDNPGTGRCIYLDYVLGGRKCTIMSGKIQK
jgi:hypothetical protein